MKRDEKKPAALIVAVEMFAVFGSWGQPDRKIEGLPFRACLYEREGRQIYVVRSGPGQIAAAAATQMAISVFGAGEIWNFGAAGGLTPDMRVGTICVPERVFRWDSDLDDQPVSLCLPSALSLCRSTDEEKGLSDASSGSGDDLRKLLKEIRIVTAASGDRVVSGPGQRQALSGYHSASIVEMEAAAIAMTAARNGVRAFFVKGISDDPDTLDSCLMQAFRQVAEDTFKVMDIMLKLQDPV